MDEDIIEKAETYATRTARHLSARLGFGIHGIVFALEGNLNPGAAALKIHYSEEPYRRERNVYLRLRDEGIDAISGLKVPNLIAFDDALLALEMTIVQPPFLLDFASAYLDFRRDFSDDVWAEWNDKNQEQFGDNWPAAQAIIGELEELGIFMLDPSPSNIRFR